MECHSEEKADGLEIVSIGALHAGPWDKKYWSCSRGKGRYPYPVGYQALRTYAGITYRMEIQEGVKGPLFVVTSPSGDSCSGQTPDISWNISGKRVGLGIDGIEASLYISPRHLEPQFTMIKNSLRSKRKMWLMLYIHFSPYTSTSQISLLKMVTVLLSCICLNAGTLLR
ncbi:unnamed protein product [Spirodela intermedia]|uniref:Uncharacterized protein n=1 Tax=Spirodela intermedia TaxID=51605 RepID=A0A7I8IYY4_SPIIN|nr:unnamed protein product [Spirodela intermedia]CAA6662932.1 unnamed protein product [Spirodela intermedia]